MDKEDRRGWVGASRGSISLMVIPLRWPVGAFHCLRLVVLGEGMVLDTVIGAVVVVGGMEVG